MATNQAFPALGGIESHIDEVSRRMSSKDYAITVLCTDRLGDLPNTEEHQGTVIRRFRAYPSRRDYYFSPGLFRSLLVDNYDVLHVQGVHALVPPMAMFAAILRRKPFVITFHTGGSTSELRARMRGVQFALLGLFIRRASALVAVSEYEASRLSRLCHIRRDRFVVIRNGGVLPTPPGNVKVDDSLILSIGRLEKYKGHQRAIAALAEIRKTLPAARLQILGAGPYESELLRIAKDYGVEDAVRIEFVPPATRHLMATRISAAAVVVLLSEYEAHPVAVMEALALGRPVVVARTSGMSELADAGWVVGVPSEADPLVVAAAILETRGKASGIEPALLPTWESTVKELADVYDRILAR